MVGWQQGLPPARSQPKLESSSILRRPFPDFGFREEISHGTCLILDNCSTVVTVRKASSPFVPRPRSSIIAPSYLVRTPTRSDDWSGSAIKVIQVPECPNECFESIATLSLANCDSEIVEFHLGKYPCDHGDWT